MRIRNTAEAERLIELAEKKSAAGRETLYRDLWQLFEDRGSELSDTERSLIGDILRRLSRDIEMSVRMRLAEQLAQKPGAPRELVLMLANDTIELAYPILMESHVLQDPDLVEIVRYRTLQHQLAIASRSNIGAVVSQALAETGNEDVITTLINNHSAELSTDLMEHLAAESKRIDQFQAPLVRRPDLPGPVARRMYAWVSAALRQYIVKNFDVDVEGLDAEVSAAVDTMAGRADDLAPDPHEASQRLIEKLHRGGQISHGFLVKTLQQGEVTLFELGLAKLSGLRPALVRRIIYDPDGRPLAIVCRSIGMDRAVYATLYKHLREVRDGTEVPAESLFKLKNFFDSILRSEATRLTGSWALNPDYLEAIKQISHGT